MCTADVTKCRFKMEQNDCFVCDIKVEIDDELLGAGVENEAKDLDAEEKQGELGLNLATQKEQTSVDDVEQTHTDCECDESKSVTSTEKVYTYGPVVVLEDCLRLKKVGSGTEPKNLHDVTYSDQDDESHEEGFHEIKKPRRRKKTHFSIKLNFPSNSKKRNDYSKIICKECGNEFKTKQSLAKHKKTHSFDRPFKCAHCEKPFLRKADLQRHELIHTGEKPFKCHFCTKAFRLKSHLQKHEAIHTGEKSFACQFCGRCFIQKGHCEYHERRHQQKGPATPQGLCQYCGRLFISVNYCVMMHEKEHLVQERGHVEGALISKE